MIIYHQVVVASLKRLRIKGHKSCGDWARAEAYHFCKLRNFSVRFMRIRLCDNYLSFLANAWAGLGAQLKDLAICQLEVDKGNLTL